MRAWKRREARRRWRFTTAALLVLGCTSTFTATAAAEATTFTQSLTIPIRTGFISCEGELVFLTGELHILRHGTQDATGSGNHLVEQLNVADLHGVGTESGALYVSTDHFVEIFNGKFGDPDAAREDTIDRSFTLVAQGGLSNARVHVIG